MLPGKEYIFFKVFTKNLNDHFINIYRFLSRNIGKTFKIIFSNAENINLDSIISINQTIYIKTILIFFSIIEFRN